MSKKLTLSVPMPGVLRPKAATTIDTGKLHCVDPTHVLPRDCLTAAGHITQPISGSHSCLFVGLRHGYLLLRDAVQRARQGGTTREETDAFLHVWKSYHDAVVGTADYLAQHGSRATYFQIFQTFSNCAVDIDRHNALSILYDISTSVPLNQTDHAEYREQLIRNLISPPASPTLRYFYEQLKVRKL